MGHRYWSGFSSETKAAVETISNQLHHALYDPPIGSDPITTLDVPVGGRGYNTLSFIFDLVNHANRVAVADTTSKKADARDVLPDDADGRATLSYLNEVRKHVQRITGDHSMSLGLHPVVYFYTRSGTFQPTAFIAISKVMEDLATRNKLDEFTRVRKDFEQFIIERKEAMSILIHKFGSGDRSLTWLYRYYQIILDGLWAGKTANEIQADFEKNPDFTFLTVPRPSGVRPESTRQKKDFNTETKTATFFAASLPTATRCAICGGLVHRNSMHFDHKVRVREGGTADMSNAQVTHPYCDSTYKERLAS